MMKRSGGPVRYALYLRCSTDEQTEGEFTTLDAQAAQTQRHVLSLGGGVGKTYSDGGKTGTNLKRPGWKALLADAQAGLFDAVCITFYNRLGRGDAATIAEYLLNEAGVSVACVHEQYADDEAGYVNKSVNRLTDGMFVRHVRRQTVTKMREMFDRGFVCGHVPFGYTKQDAPGMEATRGSDGKLKPPPQCAVPDEVRAEVVRQAFRMLLEVGTIAAARVYLTSETGRIWTTTETKRLLTDERYTGVALFGQWRKEDAHPSLIARETWEEAQNTLRRCPARLPNADSPFAYYLRGRVRCPHCGTPYTQLSVNRTSANRSKRLHYYVCLSAQKGRTKCPVTRLNAEALHYTVLHEIERAARHTTVMHQRIAASGGWGSADDAQKALRGGLGKHKQLLEARITRYVKRIGDGVDSPSLVTALGKDEESLVAVTQQISQAEQEITAATVKRPTAAQLQAVWGRVVALWPTMTEEEREDVLGGLLDYVEVKTKDRVLLQFLPIAEVHGRMLVPKRQLGAGVGLEPTTSGL